MTGRTAMALRALVAVTGLGLVAAGCGEESAGSEPVATAVVTEGVGGVEPFAEPACRAPREAAERNAPGVGKAAAELRKLGERKFGGRYAGLVPCVPEERVVLYRLPSGGDDLKRQANRIGRKHEVDVAFADALFTRKQADAAREAVLEQFALLEEAGAPFAFARVHENGTTEVAVRSNVAAAEQALAGLLDRIFVVLVPEATPAG